MTRGSRGGSRPPLLEVVVAAREPDSVLGHLLSLAELRYRELVMPAQDGTQGEPHWRLACAFRRNELTQGSLVTSFVQCSIGDPITPPDGNQSRRLAEWVLDCLDRHAENYGVPRHRPLKKGKPS